MAGIRAGREVLGYVGEWMGSWNHHTTQGQRDLSYVHDAGTGAVLIRIVFEILRLGDVEDPEIYAAEPLMEFMRSEKGAWVKDHCANPLYAIESDLNTMGYSIAVYGFVDDEAATYYKLRWL